ncbi:serine hydrolase [Paenibacillus puldeungensis]|uniref:Serine hydrolase n=1 Tax=Paenibacillus puldeungensis TaxID=696536 RepID=A0ABW3S446_9BACL
MLVYIAIGIVSFVLLAAGLLVWMAKRQIDRKTEQDVLEFLAQQPDCSSVVAIENGQVVIDYQSNVKRPLASVLKIVIAAEFAEQAAQGTIQPDEMISLADLNRFYIPNSDGNAHSSWLGHLGQETTDGAESSGFVPLIEVTRGMIQFSSNANTEFLMEKLGLDNINRRITALGLSEHDPIYPVSSAMLMYAHLIKNDCLSSRQAEQAMKNFSDEQYVAIANQLFDMIRQLPDTISDLNRINLPLSAQAVWSDRLPRSTAKEYAQLLQSIQNGERLSPIALPIFYDIMERKPNPESPIERIGFKGGSTLDILNEALYYRDKAGNEGQLVIFIHERKRMELFWLKNKLDLFLRAYLTNPEFRNSAVTALGKSTRENTAVEPQAI